MEDSTSIPFGYCHCGCGQQTTVPKYNDRKNGEFAGKPKRFCRGHNKLRPLSEHYVLDPVTECWNWIKDIDKDGYGLAYRDGTIRFAHIVVFENEFGAVPAGKELDHKCRNRRCVNPSHLEPVTHAVNIQRGRMTKLIQGQVNEIRASEEPIAVLASRFGVSESTISDVRNRKTWK